MEPATRACSEVESCSFNSPPQIRLITKSRKRLALTIVEDGLLLEVFGLELVATDGEGARNDSASPSSHEGEVWSRLELPIRLSRAQSRNLFGEGSIWAVSSNKYIDKREVSSPKYDW